MVVYYTSIINIHLPSNRYQYNGNTVRARVGACQNVQERAGSILMSNYNPFIITLQDTRYKIQNFI